LSSSSDTIIGTKGEDEGGEGGGMMGQPHLEGLKKNGKMGQNINPLSIYGRAMKMNFGLYYKFEKEIKPRILKDNKFAKAKFFKKL
jgi:hypothetical protein